MMKYKIIICKATKLITATLALIVVVQLTGCSKLAYHFADWIIVRNIDTYLDLTREQKKVVKGLVKHHLARAEAEEYQLYIALVEDLKTGFVSGLTPTNFDQLSEQYHGQLGDSLKRLTPDLGELLVSLSPDQIDHLEKKLLADNNKTYHYLDFSSEKRKKERQKLLLKELKHWFGRMNKEQKRQIFAWQDEIPDIDHVWHGFAEQQLKAFTNQLRQTKDANNAAKFVEMFWLERESFFTPELEKQYQQQKSDIKSLILKIEGSLTEKQRNRAEKKFDSYIDLLNAIKKDKKVSQSDLEKELRLINLSSRPTIIR